MEPKLLLFSSCFLFSFGFPVPLLRPKLIFYKEKAWDYRRLNIGHSIKGATEGRESHLKEKELNVCH